MKLPLSGLEFYVYYIAFMSNLRPLFYWLLTISEKISFFHSFFVVTGLCNHPVITSFRNPGNLMVTSDGDLGWQPRVVATQPLSPRTDISRPWKGANYPNYPKRRGKLPKTEDQFQPKLVKTRGTTEKEWKCLLHKRQLLCQEITKWSLSSCLRFASSYFYFTHVLWAERVIRCPHYRKKTNVLDPFHRVA